MQIGNPYREDRKLSPGEANQALAEWFRFLFRLVGVNLSEKEREHLAYVMPAFTRRWPILYRFSRKPVPRSDA